MYQQGLFSIPNGTQDFDVLFPVNFDGAPDLIIPIVTNLVDQTNVLSLRATPSVVTQSGFSIHLDSATNSANYKLGWIAGDFNVVYATIVTGRRGSDLPTWTGQLADTDFVFFVRAALNPETYKLPISVFKAMFLSFIGGDPPASPTATGVMGNTAITRKFFYSHDGTFWGQTPRATSNWQSDP